ncbi:hypothetical protein G7Y89_g4296 [Cudoniella acicularis]|uniref:Uncharacterized protein n=1 Tax=Cudoniella acicularis TaxID=354080 RepID=A0A8H4RRQ6_9HELO|nr:hypothetical protein G7Y89_g4296 [Cudoniella acicularis]
MKLSRHSPGAFSADGRGDETRRATMRASEQKKGKGVAHRVRGAPSSDAAPVPPPVAAQKKPQKASTELPSLENVGSSAGRALAWHSLLAATGFSPACLSAIGMRPQARGCTAKAKLRAYSLDASASARSALHQRALLLFKTKRAQGCAAIAFGVPMAQQNNRNSPHLSAHLQNGPNGSAPSSPSMSSANQNPGQSRQPVNYPSPTSYPSPNGQYNYPVPPNQQVNEPYRASPTGSNGSLSLPSMRTLDSVQQQQQAHQHQMASGLPPVAPMGGPYYHNQGQTLPHPSHQYPNVTSDPTGQNMRYALPVTDARVMSGGRHKKEIKRRTKTGCLTCRKRRIKAKAHELALASRARETRSRDFLQFAIQTPPASQLLTSRAVRRSSPSLPQLSKVQARVLGLRPHLQAAARPCSHPACTQLCSLASRRDATANPYGNQPQMLQSGYGVPVSSMSYEPSLSAGVSSPGSASQQFDYASAIDPALEAAAPPAAVAGNAFQNSPGMPTFRDLKRDVQSASPFSSGASTPHLRGGASSFISPSIASSEEYSAYTTTPAKRTVSQLLDLGGVAPSADITLNANQMDETKHLFYSIYAPGIENFLESKWFSVNGLPLLMKSKKILDQFGALLSQFAKTPQTDPKEMAYTSSVEARIVWALSCMVRAGAEAQPKQEFAKTVPAVDDPVEAANRLAVFENLLTGNVASGNPLTQPVPNSTDHHRLRELEFWYTLANFVALPYDDTGSAKDIDNCLSALRNLLDGRENRDVLYSIAVVRAIGQRVSEYTDSDTPLHFDESDNKSKLLVAKKFIIDEASGAGTTNVIRRLCELTARSWAPVSAAAAAPTPAK